MGHGGGAAGQGDSPVDAISFGFLGQSGRSRFGDGFSPQADGGAGISGASGGRSLVGNTGPNAFAGAVGGYFNGNDLNKPLDNSETSALLKQSTYLTELPKFTSLDGIQSKAERVRAWRREVERKIAALHPNFQEHWNWSWSVADAMYNHWLSLGASGRASLKVTGPIPPRYTWLENWFKDKVVNALPKQLQAEHRGDERSGVATSVHGLLCYLFMVNQPGGLTEKADVMKKLMEPNVCSQAAAALNELRNWKAAVRRASEVELALPDPGILFRSVVSIYRGVFEASTCNAFLNNKWLTTYNRIDPHQGNNITIDDIEAINDFANAELYSLAISNESAASTGLPLTDVENEGRKKLRRRTRRPRRTPTSPTSMRRKAARAVAAKMADLGHLMLRTRAAEREKARSKTSRKVIPPPPARGPLHAPFGMALKVSVPEVSRASSSTRASPCSAPTAT